MLNALLLCGLGLAALIAGAEMLVRGGRALANRLGISPLIIGLAFVAIGTSAPELAVGIEAALQGNGALAIGNISGTNTVNILLILGLSAMIQPLRLGARAAGFDLSIMVIASLTLLLMCWDGALSWQDGGFLLFGAVAYTAMLVRTARRENAAVRFEPQRRHGSRAYGGGIRNYGADLLLLAAGIAIVVAGADWLVDGAVQIARRRGVSDAVIGLTIVAIGTSAPELATTVVSTIRGDRDIAVGNLVGSCIYNILGILGITCLVASSPMQVGLDLILVDIPLMAGSAVLCMLAFRDGREVSRAEGGVAVACYLVYLGYLLIARV